MEEVSTPPKRRSKRVDSGSRNNSAPASPVASVEDLVLSAAQAVSGERRRSSGSSSGKHPKRPKIKRASLLGMPPEIILEIASYLEGSDVHSLAMTSPVLVWLARDGNNWELLCRKRGYQKQR